MNRRQTKFVTIQIHLSKSSISSILDSLDSSDSLDSFGFGGELRVFGACGSITFFCNPDGFSPERSL